MSDDGYVTYLAANGHRMRQNRADYERGVTWSATHADSCKCETFDRLEEW